ncbi:MAG TPA: hypothetical protein VKM55_24965 [Candidatus Lokiarchaeia archaeon]|nr:hypothetical protein [Candidatus Lokiarchaeia archaeon]
MSTQIKSRTRAIKDMKFTDGHVWFYGTVQENDGDHLVIDDGTGTMPLDLVAESTKKNKDEEIPAQTVVKGDISPGAFVRVIGDVVPDTKRNFTIVPTIIQNLDELGVDKDLLSRIQALEEKYGDDITRNSGDEA